MHKLRALVLLGSVTDTEGAVQVKCIIMFTISDFNKSECLLDGSTHMTSSLLGSHVREGREHVATVSPTRTRWVSQE